MWMLHRNYNFLCHKTTDNGCITEARAGQLGHAGNSKDFVYCEFPDPCCKWEKNLYFCKYIFICLQARKNSGSKCLTRTEPDEFPS